jgi:[ribosomal protein S5]-alanine N-acetyltransferase
VKEVAMHWDLQTERLHLRPLVPDDLEAMHVVLSDPVSMRFYPRPFDRPRTRAWIDRWIADYEHGLGLLAIEERETKELVGDCGPSLQQVDGTSFVELGWHVRRDRQGRGYATEAGAVCRDHAWRVLDVDRLISLIRPENVPSWKVARKLGFRPWRGTVRAGMAHVVWSLERPAVSP